MPARRRPLRWASAPTSAASNRLAPTRTDALLKRYSSRYSQDGKRSADRAYRTTSQRCGVSAQALAATLLGEIPLGDGRTLEVIRTHAGPRTAPRLADKGQLTAAAQLETKNHADRRPPRGR